MCSNYIFSDELSNVSIEPDSNSTNYTDETQKNGLPDSDKTFKREVIENNTNNNKSVSSKTLGCEGHNIDTDANNIKVKEELPDIINDYEKDSKKTPEDILALKVRKFLKYFK